MNDRKWAALRIYSTKITPVTDNVRHTRSLQRKFYIGNLH